MPDQLPVTEQQFTDYFDRDFDFGLGMENVRPKDIRKAFAEAWANYNPCLWGDDSATVSFLYLSAHYLVLNIQAAGGLGRKKKGVRAGGRGAVGNKSIGGISVGYQLPAEIVDSPILSHFLQTEYGQKYLSLLAPRLVGGVTAVEGPREPDTSPDGPIYPNLLGGGGV